MSSARKLILLLAGAALAAGCTRESARVAIDAQRRADEIQRAVFERQHASLRVLLYRDLASRLEAAGAAAEIEDEPRAALAAAQRSALDDAWNDRDLFEFWATQYERAAALRIAAVDAKLAADQSVLDLLWKQWSAKGDRMVAGLAAAKGGRLGAPPTASQSDSESGGPPPE
jgi:hypothetical protein